MKKLLVIFTIIICLIAINNLAHSIMQTWEQQSYLVNAQNSLKQEQLHHAQLEQQLQKVSQKDFVEEQARDKLLLVKPGENLVLVPSGMISPSLDKTEQPAVQEPHWKEWWNYFFNN